MPTKRHSHFLIQSRSDSSQDLLERLKPTLDIFLESAARSAGGAEAFAVLCDPLSSGQDCVYSPNASITEQLERRHTDSIEADLGALAQLAIDSRKSMFARIRLSLGDCSVYVIPVIEKKKAVGAFGLVNTSPNISPNQSRQFAACAYRSWNALRLQIETMRKASQAYQDASMFDQVPIAAIEMDITRFIDAVSGLSSQGQEGNDMMAQLQSDQFQQLFADIRTLRVNSQMLSLMGIESSEKFLDLFPDTAVDIAQPLVVPAISAVMNGKKGVQGLYSIRRPDGRELMLSVRIVFNISQNGPSTCIAYATDRTEHMRDELRLKLSTEIDKALLGAATLAKLSKTVLVGVRALIPYSVATIRTIDDRTRSFNLAAFDGDPEFSSLVQKTIDESVLPEPSKSLIVCFGTENELSKHSAALPFFEAGINTMAMVVLVVRKEVIGYIFLGHREANAFSREHLDILRNVADDLAVGLHTLKLQDCAKKKTRELEKRVKERTAQLEAANKELESFFYSISHELRSPLRAIEGYAAMVQDEAFELLAPEGKQNLQRIRSSTQKMSKLIEDLIKLARYTRGALSRTKVDLSEMVTQMCDALSYASPNRMVEFRILPGIVANGDPQFLKSLLDELIANAWIFSSKEQKTLIEFGIFYDGDDTVFYVRDNGCGFDMEHAKQLFFPFHRFHRQDEYPGTGMGLATAERIVSRHGGRIWARSAVGQGATFYFTLSG